MRSRSSAADDGESVAAVLTGVIVIASFVYFLGMASPSLLPVTVGPDVVHHLVLIRLIQRTHHLVRGTALPGHAAFPLDDHRLGCAIIPTSTR